MPDEEGEFSHGELDADIRSVFSSMLVSGELQSVENFSNASSGCNILSAADNGCHGFSTLIVFEYCDFLFMKRVWFQS